MAAVASRYETVRRQVAHAADIAGRSPDEITRPVDRAHRCGDARTKHVTSTDRGARLSATAVRAS